MSNLISSNRWPWFFCGLLLTVSFCVVTLFGEQFGYNVPLAEKPVLLFVLALGFAGAAYLLISRFVQRAEYRLRYVVWIVAVGAAMRILMFLPPPILEDDLYRYMWDGAVTANGYNPYAYSPKDVLDRAENSKEIPSGLLALAEESGEVAGRINHPQYRTIYPPVTQGVFAIAYFISPWNTDALRLVYLLFDIATLVLLFAIMRELRLSPLLLAIYWLNPLLVKEIYNSLHMDIVAFPFVLGGLYLAGKNRFFTSVLVFALAAGTKLWPIALVPLVLRREASNTKRLLGGIALFMAAGALIFAPVFAAGLGGDAGLAVYYEKWQNNAGAFKILLWAGEFVLETMGIHPGHGQSVARVLVVVLIALWIGLLSLKPLVDMKQLFDRSVLIVGAMFLLSPTQFPWYYTWLVPLLAVSPRTSLLVLTMLLPLYYMRYFLEPRGWMFYFDNLVVWVEFIPIWILLLMESRLHFLKDVNNRG
ncbi:MAG: hypothetical protein V3U74_04850 [Thermodesulfobacteriota bacterium]